MTLPKLLVISALILFSTIGIMAFIKKSHQKSDNFPKKQTHTIINNPIEVEIGDQEKAVIIPAISSTTSVHQTLSSPLVEVVQVKNVEPPVKIVSEEEPSDPATPTLTQLPAADRVAEFFNLAEPKFPIVETITYKSKVSWQKGRPAWLSDYANHYKTSRHFIARSLNGKPDYLKQDLSEGNRFNILKPEKNIQFHFILDTSRCKMWFYYHDLDSKEKILVKTYPVCLGRIDHSKISGLLTPLGIYSLGSRIAVYKPKIMGLHNGSKIEMIRVFGTRWIPFDKEIKDTTAPAKGFGIHGVPWVLKEGTLVENTESLGRYESDGCIRMASADIEELYAIIITRPTTVEIVKDFFDAENKIQSLTAHSDK